MEAEGYIERARQRAQRRKSSWNLVLIPLVLAGICLTWFFLFKLVRNFQASHFPPDAVLSSYTRIGGILMFVPLFFPALSIGMMIGNLIAWCIPGARAVFEAEAAGVRHASFHESMKDLGKATAILLPIALVISLIGARNYFYLTKNDIAYEPLGSMKLRHYRWDQISKISTDCYFRKDTIDLSFLVTMADRTSMDWLSDSRTEFYQAYPIINSLLQGRSFEFVPGPFQTGKMLMKWSTILTTRPGAGRS